VCVILKREGREVRTDTFNTTFENKSAIIGGLPWVFHFVILYSSILWIQIYETIILPVVLYGCETLSLTLREDHRLRGCSRTGC
jgi:hypothetical protein